MRPGDLPGRVAGAARLAGPLLRRSLHAPGPRSGPLVSVITATWNWPSALREAIGSVRAQTYRDWELIVVGDRCTDETEALVLALAAQEPRLRWIARSENSGSQSLPNNDGLRVARGRYVAYLGHDDVWHPTHLQRLVGALEATGADVGHGVAVSIGPPRSLFADLVGAAPPPPGRRPFVFPSALAHRRELVDRIGPWRDHREIAEPPDREFQRRAWDAGTRWVSTGALTVFKLNAALRRGAYARKTADEQIAIRRRMTRPGYVQWQIVRACALMVAPVHRMEFPPDLGPDAAPGAQVEAWRRFKGAA